MERSDRFGSDGRNQRLRPHRAASGAFVFLLLAGFALLSMLVVAVGAEVYRTVEKQAEENYDARTALSYVAGKVRSCDAASAVSVATLDGEPVLQLCEEIEGVPYCTYIYWYQGGLQEYFGAAARAFNPAFGETIVPAAGFEAQLGDDGLLHVCVTDARGGAHSLTLYLQSTGGGLR